MLIEEKLVNYLKEHNLKISFAESCTGGLLASTIISVPGASNIISESYVTYSNEAKMKLLNVKKETLDKYTVYSEEVALEMCDGLKRISESNICASVTGLAGGNDLNKLDGTFFYSIIIEAKQYVFSSFVTGTRNVVREKQVNEILNKIYQLLIELQA